MLNVQQDFCAGSQRDSDTVYLGSLFEYVQYLGLAATVALIIGGPLKEHLV